MKHEFINANGIKFHYVTEGEGPLLLLLHGFPQNWYAWRHQIPELAKHFKVVAPDLRGYGETDKPDKVSDYEAKPLTGDIVALIRALGYDKAHILAHDWGGAIAWRVAMYNPQVVDRLVVLNCPHPHLFTQALKTNPRQRRRSWYIALFNIPVLPEILFNLFGRKILKRMFKGAAIRKEAFSDEDIEQYFQALTKPGALSGALNYYRAALRKAPSGRQLEKKIQRPTLLLWGEKDAALGKELTYGMEDLFTAPFEVQYVPECSHWIAEEQPDLVNRSALAFLGKTS